MSAKTISINRAPVLTLWAAVVAERLGFDGDEALTLGKAVAGLNAQAKGRRLGIFKPHEEQPTKARKKERGEEFRIEICSRPVPARNTAEGIRAVKGAQVIEPDGVRRYLEGKFGDDLGRVRSARLDDAGRDESVKCVIIGAAGLVFSAGHDLAELVDASEAERESLFALCTEVMEAIRMLPMPVIAQVQGLATAAGCQLVATCDLVVASEGAHFATPGVKIGLFCTTPAVALSRAVHPRKALEMLLTGTPITAREAERIGLVNRVVSPERLEAETLALARQVAEASSDTLGLGKRAFFEQRHDVHQL